MSWIARDSGQPADYPQGMVLPSPARPDGAFLVVRSGHARGARFPARDGLTIGRHPLNDVCLRDEGVATHHAVLHLRGEDWMIELLSPADTLPRRLRLEQPVRVGVVELVLAAEETEPPQVARVGTTIIKGLPARGQPGEGFDAPTGLDPAELEKVLSFEASVAEERDLEHLLDVLADWIHATVPTESSAILLADEQGSLRPFRHRSASGEPVQPSQSIVHEATERGAGVLIVDAAEDARVRHGMSIHVNNIRSALCVPLVARREVVGALYCATQGIRSAFGENHLRLLTLVAGPAASAVKSALLVRELSDTNRDLLRRLSICARFNDDDTGYHIQRVGDYAAQLAHALGQPETFIALLRAAAPMHDIGKIGIPQAILQKPGRLTKEEFEHMKRHTTIGEQILGGSRAPLVRLAAEVAATHHERPDGRGYPRGLTGEHIPLSGRIVAVADVFDALTTARCYKPAFELDKAYGILREGAGTQFDATIIEAFFGSLDAILDIRARYARLEQRRAQAPAG